MIDLGKPNTERRQPLFALWKRPKKQIVLSDFYARERDSIFFFSIPVPLIVAFFFVSLIPEPAQRSGPEGRPGRQGRSLCGADDEEK